MIRTQISMTEDQAKGLKRMSQLRQKSQAAVLRDALDQVLGDEARLVRIERARDAIGRFRSGERSTSVDHDAVLADVFAE